jgi:hypothetical protein
MSLSKNIDRVPCEKEVERAESDPAIKTEHSGVLLLPQPSDDSHDPLVGTSLCSLEDMD